MASHARQLDLLSINEYLAGEQHSAVKHEYVDGVAYAMVGGNYAHNLIASNVLGELHRQLRGKPCRVLNSDCKILAQGGSQTRFYYPDVSVVCGDKIRREAFQDQPTVVVEVMSPSTRRIDEGEKREVYQSMNSIMSYLLFEQDFPAAAIYRRTDNGFERSLLTQLGGVIELPEIDCELSMASVYAEVVFPSSPRAAGSDAES